MLYIIYYFVSPRKAEELSRLLDVSGTLSLTASAKGVICLELAASLTGVTFDKAQAVRLSGLTRPKYVSMSENVARALGVSVGASINDLCVTLSATAARDLAVKVLKQYEQSLGGDGSGKGGVAVDGPAYQAAAVAAACTAMKVREVGVLLRK